MNRSKSSSALFLRNLLHLHNNNATTNTVKQAASQANRATVCCGTSPSSTVFVSSYPRSFSVNLSSIGDARAQARGEHIHEIQSTATTPTTTSQLLKSNVQSQEEDLNSKPRRLSEVSSGLDRLVWSLPLVRRQ